jgi:hypothetical protein
MPAMVEKPPNMGRNSTIVAGTARALSLGALFWWRDPGEPMRVQHGRRVGVQSAARTGEASKVTVCQLGSSGLLK